ncbi:serpin B [Paenibacillus phyllosphaerae]|uniref:Serpin B n=1 Tax=Paenibacillus phyllosphaerae TaxID=274593 RepID=A0A7W5FL32_9BACL|nr:serpin family protein [Paenibacillus phyllosphaerae]MBB3108614.1 serpin B [Paenibacillus phyllosphaerae]
MLQRLLRPWFLLLIAACLLFGCSACGQQTSTTRFTAADVSTSQVQAHNAFALRLAEKLVAADGQNHLISPLSISLALSMAASGASGATQAEMLRTLAASGLSAEDMDRGSEVLMELLEASDSDTTVQIANSLWADEGTPLREPYVSRMQQYYAAPVKQLEFGDEQEAVDTMNRWVSKQTGGKIPTIIEQLSDESTAVLINAISFQGKWSEPFEKSQTREVPVYLSKDRSVAVPMMKQTETFPYKQESSFQAIELPYGNGNWHMTIVLPAAGKDLAALLPELLADPSLWQDGLSDAFGTVELPRFTAQSSFKLKETLKQLGMVHPFDRSQADFSGMAEDGASYFIQEVLHKTFIQVDEQGTEAAAATAIMTDTGSAPAEPFAMKIDRPFFYAIEEATTGTLVFLGTMADPSAP